MLKEKLNELVSACFSGIWVETFEFQEAIDEIAQLCRNEEWRFASWDVVRGLCVEAAENAVELMQCSTSWVQKMSSNGKLDFAKSSRGPVRFWRNHIVAWLWGERGN